MEQLADIRKRLITAIAAPAAVMLIITALLSVLAVQLASVNRDAATVENTISLAHNLERLIVDSETGFRGFLLVAGDDMLEPMIEADTRLPGRFATLRDAVAGEPDQIRRLDTVERIYASWNALAAREIAMKRDGSDDVSVIASRKPKRQIDDIRSELNAFVTALEQRRDASRARVARFTRVTLVTISTCGLVLAAVLWSVTWRQVSRVFHEYAAAHDETARQAEQLRFAAATLEARVAERTHELEQANKELEAFSYSVSHDLRAPLRHVSAFAKLLADNVPAESSGKVHHYVDRILQRTREAGELIDNLLAFSRTGRAPMSLTLVDTQQLVREVIEGMLDIEDREIEWRIDELPSVYADIRMLRQVFMNLIGNAVKYTRGQPVARIGIVLRVSEADADVFTIRDNGAGFDQQYAGKLFNVFQRLHTSHEFEGNGIGLAIVRRIIMRHGGETWASGRVGEGAAFSFSLPRQPRHPVVAPMEGTAA